MLTWLCFFKMSRNTMQDAMDVVPNRFELVLLVSQRTRELCSGTQRTVESNTDSEVLTALDEIAAQTINIETLKLKTVSNMKSGSNHESMPQTIGMSNLDEIFANIEPDSGEIAKTNKYNESIINNNIFADQNISPED